MTEHATTRTASFVPIIDLTDRNTESGRRIIADAIHRACETSGFFGITGHGIPAELVTRMCATTREFFLLPDTEKDLVAHRPGVSGFRRAGGSTAHSLDRKTPPDLCEVFSAHVTGDLSQDERDRLGNYWASWKLANIWPSRPTGFESTWRAYMRALTDLSADLMRLFALALGLDEDFFDDKFDRHVSSVTVNYYYPQRVPPLPGQLRRGAHTDWGTLTILHQDTDIGGLQIRLPSGEWRDVPMIPGGFIVNIGDLTALWTAGRWRSTLHRVVNPAAGSDASRLSIPFFYLPNHDAPLHPIADSTASAAPDPSGISTAGQWISRKMQKTFAADPENFESAD
ncbi:isopenicillin N synthase family dioxygenase [Nocardia acidivorans]|uniref:isopenicillin N synthase family dioxygenase n=1 Tax=Nocardia acidivorans TaxID=404580 RepID=UPI00082F72C1|nr:2-oxoglutarate and iron-dependent oxygenase domain-containing protein [Nocardia acidivorans]